MPPRTETRNNSVRDLPENRMARLHRTLIAETRHFLLGEAQSAARIVLLSEVSLVACFPLKAACSSGCLSILPLNLHCRLYTGPGQSSATKPILQLAEHGWRPHDSHPALLLPTPTGRQQHAEPRSVSTPRLAAVRQPCLFSAFSDVTGGIATSTTPSFTAQSGDGAPVPVTMPSHNGPPRCGHAASIAANRSPRLKIAISPIRQLHAVPLADQDVSFHW